MPKQFQISPLIFGESSKGKTERLCRLCEKRVLRGKNGKFCSEACRIKFNNNYRTFLKKITTYERKEVFITTLNPKKEEMKISNG